MTSAGLACRSGFSSEGILAIFNSVDIPIDRPKPQFWIAAHCKTCLSRVEKRWLFDSADEERTLEDLLEELLLLLNPQELKVNPVSGGDMDVNAFAVDLDVPDLQNTLMTAVERVGNSQHREQLHESLLFELREGQGLLVDFAVLMPE